MIDKLRAWVLSYRCKINNIAMNYSQEVTVMNVYSKLGWFVGGALFGSAGIKILSSKDAKKAYTHTTAAVLRMKNTVMTTVNTVQENCSDILADAKDINEQRAADAEGEIIEAAEPETV